jgi:nicotinamide-nucleotide amidase
MQSLVSLGASVGALLKDRGQTVAIAETTAGGLISAALLSVDGASKYYSGGGIIYALPARMHLLGITKQHVAGLRSSSEPYAQLLAKVSRERLGATWGLGETGAAGPTGNKFGDAPGHTCIAVSGPLEAAITVETRSDDREANMWVFARRALELLEKQLRAADR